MKSKQILILFLIITALSSCSGDPPKKEPVVISRREADSLIIEMEKKYNQMEEDRIRNYISNHAPMEKTGSGYWFVIHKKNPKGKEIADQNLVKYSRMVSLLNSRELYNDTVILKVGHGEEIRGMHESLKLLREGEAATFIFPSYLAHGLLGDMKKVPPKAELIYEVKVLDVQ